MLEIHLATTNSKYSTAQWRSGYGNKTTEQLHGRSRSGPTQVKDVYRKHKKMLHVLNVNLFVG